MARAGRVPFEPYDINARGTIVGGYFNEVGNSYFLNQKGKESEVLLGLGSDSTFFDRISINDNDQITVNMGTELLFFDGPTKRAEVIAPPGTNFTRYDSARFPFVHTLSDGAALVGYFDGSAHLATVTSDGTITTLPESVLSHLGAIDLVTQQEKSLKNAPHGGIYFSTSGRELFYSDLMNEDIRIRMPRTSKTKGLSIFDYNGEEMLAERTVLRTADVELSQDDYLVVKGRAPVRVACIFPNSFRYSVSLADRLLSNGDVLVAAGETFGIIPRSRLLDRKLNYCVQTNIKIIGQCATLFNSRLIQLAQASKDMRCTGEVTITDPKGVPLNDILIKVGDTFPGKTDKHGENQFNFQLKAGLIGSSSLSIVAPYNHPQWKANVGTIYFYGYHFA